MGLDMTSFDAALKEYYTTDKVEELTYKKWPFLGLLPKMTEFYGDVMPVPVYLENPQGRSASFSRAQARSKLTSSLVRRFMITRVEDYGVCVIDRQTIKASEKDKGAFLKAKTTEINGIYDEVSKSMAIQAMGAGWGSRGQVGSFTGATITLKDTKMASKFAVGMELGLAAAESTGAARAYGSSNNGLIVSKIDRDLGKLTFGYNVNDSTNGIPNIANDDYIFARGDRQEGSSPAKELMSGFSAWIPDTAPTSGDSHFGLDRSEDPTKLAGHRRDVSGAPTDEALIDIMAYCAQEECMIDHMFIHPMRWGDLNKIWSGKYPIVYAMGTQSIGYKAFEVEGEVGTVKIVSDRTVPYDRVNGVKLDTWELASLGEAPHAFNDEGFEMLRQSDADGFEARIGHYSNIVCRAPKDNIVGKF